MKTQSLAMKSVVILILLGGLLFQGCTSLHTFSSSAPGLSEGDEVIVELKSGGFTNFNVISVNGNEIEGIDKLGVIRAINLSTVRSLSVRRFDAVLETRTK